MQENNNYQRWFVDSFYTYAGAPKLEAALMRYARHHFLHCLVYEKDIKDVVSNIKAAQEKIYEQNRRLKKVRVECSKTRLGADDDIIWLYIGEQHLVLQKVREEIETVDPQFHYALVED